MELIRLRLILSSFAVILVVGCWILAAGCCGTKETVKEEAEVTTSTITVPVPVIEDTLDAIEDTLSVKIDSAEQDEVLIHGEKIEGKDTTISVKYFLKKKKMAVKVIPPDVKVDDIDTTKIIHKTEVVKSPGFWEKEFWYIAGFLFLLIIFFIILKIKI